MFFLMSIGIGNYTVFIWKEQFIKHLRDFMKLSISNGFNKVKEKLIRLISLSFIFFWKIFGCLWFLSFWIRGCFDYLKNCYVTIAPCILSKRSCRMLNGDLFYISSETNPFKRDYFCDVTSEKFYPPYWNMSLF